VTRRAFARNLAATAASVALDASPTSPEPPPGDMDTERLLEIVAAQVTGGLTEAERARVRGQIRGMIDVLAALRKADVAPGADPGLAWSPVVPEPDRTRRR
jgi:hypothetical protein